LRIAYYPGCSLETSAAEYGLSVKKTARILGIELQEIPDWNCCGATSAHSTSKLLSLALPARNLALAEREGLDVLAPCAACYSRFRATEHRARKDAGTLKLINEAIGMEYGATNRTVSVLELLAAGAGLETLAGKVTQPLKGLRPACYYGCFLVRPVEYTGFDDPEYPQSMEKIVRILGAEPVAWSHQTECCGASLATTVPEVGLRMAYEVLKNAEERGADSIVTACPLCHMNLDMRRGQIERMLGVKLAIPVYYITQLVAMACGESPENVGVNRHFVEAVRQITHLPSETTEAVACGAETDAGE
jgi:heterodisulfide reductase subunit B